MAMSNIASSYSRFILFSLATSCLVQAAVLDKVYFSDTLQVDGHVVNEAPESLQARTYDLSSQEPVEVPGDGNPVFTESTSILVEGSSTVVLVDLPAVPTFPLLPIGDLPSLTLPTITGDDWNYDIQQPTEVASPDTPEDTTTEIGGQGAVASPEASTGQSKSYALGIPPPVSTEPIIYTSYPAVEVFSLLKVSNGIPIETPSSAINSPPEETSSCTIKSTRYEMYTPPVRSATTASAQASSYKSPLVASMSKAGSPSRRVKTITKTIDITTTICPTPKPSCTSQL